MRDGGALACAPVYLLRWALLLAGLSLCFERTSLAADPTTPEAVEARGRELFENGAILYDEGRYEDAILAWQEGYRLTQRSGFLFNIANAQERIGDYEAAIDTLGRYRALAKAEERETLDRRIRNLEERLAATPAPRPVPAPVPVQLPDPVPRPEPKGGPPGRAVAGVSLLGVGAVSLVAGGVFGLQSKAAGRDATALCGDGAAGLLCPQEAEPLLARNRRSALFADIGFSVGAVSAASGALLLALPRRSGADDHAQISIGASGIVLTGLLP